MDNSKKINSLIKAIINIGSRFIILIVIAGFISKVSPNLINLNMWLMKVFKFSFTPNQVAEMFNNNSLGGELFEYCIISGSILIVTFEIFIIIISHLIGKIKCLNIGKKDVKDFVVGIFDANIIVLLVFAAVVQLSYKFMNKSITSVEEAYQTLYFSVIIPCQLLVVKGWFKLEYNFAGIGKSMLVGNKHKNNIVDVEETKSQ